MLAKGSIRRARLRRAVVAITLGAALALSGTVSPALANVGPPPVSTVQSAAGTITRLAGVDRYATSVAVSRTFPAKTDAVFVATGADFPDALSGAAAAASKKSPVLLTPRDQLPASVAAEIKRLAPKRIYVLGGSGVVSGRVVSTLAGIAPTQRISGVTRYETASAIVKKFFPSAPEVILATGRTSADALVAGAAGGSRSVPTLMIDGTRDTVDNATLQTLKELGTTTIRIAGGHGAISIRIEQQLRTAGYDVHRSGGASRFETAVELMAAIGPENPTAVYLATGTDFPDALSAAAVTGGRSAALILGTSACLPTVSAQALNKLADVPRFVVGGTAVLSDAAASGRSCGDTVPKQGTWRTSGFTFSTAVDAPYADRPPVDVHDPSIRLDSTGLRIYNRVDNGQRADHPVAYAQYGISALAEYQRTGERVWLDRATRHAQRLIEMHTDRGEAWFYPYLFPWTYPGVRMGSQWWSMMAQGEALSLFTRLYEETGDEQWKGAADHTWQSFLSPRSTSEPWGVMTDGGRLWLEEYAANVPPLMALNGHIFAVFGLYDYYKLTGDATVLKYLDGATTAVLEVMPAIRKPGGVSYYCARANFCQTKTWQNAAYHPIHIWQLRTLARLTSDGRFTTWADRLRSDVPGSSTMTDQLDGAWPIIEADPLDVGE
ncbi:cell wall-binding repeat-containing protein [Microbacterium gorillae]|uniref:cell wall-binding repeat-containing protein n=1 Tax=Microbacterium gorillae TaxID=1231063 RepID=UPI00058B441A|nr:cell wall-binding repeat-containing protein [Microbacterium gorillae]